MSMVLPKEIAFSPELPSLPNDTTSYEVVLQPSNVGAAGVGASGLIEFNLPSRGFLVPDSLYLRYKVTCTNSGAAAAATTAGIRGCPAYSFFQKLETYAGSQLLEVQNEYGMMMNDLINCTMSMDQKYGMQAALGYSFFNTANAATSQVSLDCRNFFDASADGATVLAAGASDIFTVAAPLQCVLSNAEKLVPLEFMPNVIVRLTTDTIANVINGYTGVNINIGYTLSNLELVYTTVNFNSDVLGMVQGMGDANGKFFVKSSSFALSGSSFAASSGNRELQYSHRFASIRSIYAHFQTGATAAVNGKFDSVAPENATGGTYQFTINSVPYPQREISSTLNKSAVLMELRKSFGGLTSKTNSMSINTREFSVIDGGATTDREPAKFIIGVDTQKLASDSLLTGVSSQNANVTLRINSTNTNLITAYCYVNFDELLEIDPQNKSVIARY